MLYPLGATVLLPAASVWLVYFETVGVNVAKTPFCLVAIVLN
jgi:hypothetical protein